METLKWIQKTYGVSMYQVSKKTGIGQPTLSKLINGKLKMSFGVAYKLSKAYNLNVMEVVKKEGIV